MLQQDKKAELILFTHSKALPVFSQLFEDQTVIMVHFDLLSLLPSKIKIFMLLFRNVYFAFSCLKFMSCPPHFY